ncbi:glycoside hydrolase family protein [Bifidobacterium leontopitheci]|uniref:Glycosyl hydrolase family 43 n=1 Tax=Bifidobacterium leontopitheci TaxID=2650774 RepID=A0A6I1GM27_9BIFI|nr:hypothetical protein [Bifidobacterium leontopitheci]KAB7790636.1 hypothetical protein F7D09_0889 [Bifidobacterium leontopitheci]
MGTGKVTGRVIASLAATAMLGGALAVVPMSAQADDGTAAAIAAAAATRQQQTDTAATDDASATQSKTAEDAARKTAEKAAAADTTAGAAKTTTNATKTTANTAAATAAPKATNGSNGLGGDVPSDYTVTDDQIKQLDNVIYAVNAGGTVTDSTTDIGEKPYPYDNDSKLPSQSNTSGRPSRPKFKDALIGGKQADQQYTDDAAKLNWGYAASTADNPTTNGGNANSSDSFQSWRQADAKQLKDADAAAKQAYDKDGGVVYTFDLPKREKDAQDYTYSVRLGFYVSGNNIPYVKIVANPGDANQQVLRENFPVIGNVKHILTFDHIKPNANGQIVLKFQSNFKLDPANFKGAKGWNKEFTDWNGSEKQDARVSYVEVDAEPTAPTTAAGLKTALTDTYNLTTTAQQTALLNRIKANKTSDNKRADGSGTADYSSATLAAGSVKTFNDARDAALKVAAKADASAADVIAAYQKVQDAWDKIGVDYDYTSVTGVNSARLYATDGSLIQAHGGQIQKVTDVADKGNLAKYDANKDGSVWVWVGEDKTNGTSALGVHEYVSDDLANWNNIGLVLPTYQDSVKGKEFSAMPKIEFPDSAADMAADPDYQAVYGKDFDRFAGDLWNHNLKNADDVYKMLKFDMNVDEGMILERPKLIYNSKTKRWVIWFHCEGSTYGNPTSDSYSKARAGIAVSEGSDPTGPFKFLGSFRLDSNKDVNGTVDDWSNGYGQVRDMTLFVDDKDANGDGVNDAYVVYTSDGNGAVYASLLNSTYTGIASWDKTTDTTKPASVNAKAGSEVTKDNGVTYNWIAGGGMEAPAIAENNGKYYLITSGTNGWAPASAHLNVSSDGILGSYKSTDAPGTTVAGASSDSTEAWDNFISQSSNLFAIDPEQGIWGYMGNQWFNPDGGYNIADSRYIILPVRFVGDSGKMEILGDANWLPTQPLSSLVAKIEGYGLKESDYTAASWKPFAAALAYAKQTAGDKSAPEVQVDFARRSLNDAWCSLAKAGASGGDGFTECAVGGLAYKVSFEESGSGKYACDGVNTDKSRWSTWPNADSTITFKWDDGAVKASDGGKLSVTFSEQAPDGVLVEGLDAATGKWVKLGEKDVAKKVGAYDVTLDPSVVSTQVRVTMQGQWMKANEITFTGVTTLPASIAGITYGENGAQSVSEFTQDKTDYLVPVDDLSKIGTVAAVDPKGVVTVDQPTKDNGYVATITVVDRADDPQVKTVYKVTFVKRDTTAPTLDVKAPANGEVQLKDAHVTATATDDSGKTPTLEYTLDRGKTWKAFPAEGVTFAELGAATLGIRATDEQGNVSYFWGEYTVIANKTDGGNGGQPGGQPGGNGGQQPGGDSGQGQQPGSGSGQNGQNNAGGKGGQIARTGASVASVAALGALAVLSGAAVTLTKRRRG